MTVAPTNQPPRARHPFLPSLRWSAWFLSATSFIAGSLLTLCLVNYKQRHLAGPSSPRHPSLPDQEENEVHVRGNEVPSFGDREVASVGNGTKHVAFLKYGMPGPVSDMIVRDAYMLSYNRATRNAHWVGEHLTKDSLTKPPVKLDDDGEEEDLPDRKRSHFKEDASLPFPFRARLKDYLRSGYDRGHLVPAADVRHSQSALDQTFILSNVSPQTARGFNRDYWASFEDFVRSLTEQFDDVFVITGPLFAPNHVDKKGRAYVKYRVLGNPPNTAVPTHFFKVILAVNPDVSAIGGFVLPNEPILKSVPLNTFIEPVAGIERLSGLKFFPKFDRKRAKAPALCGKVVCMLASEFAAKARQGRDEWVDIDDNDEEE